MGDVEAVAVLNTMHYSLAEMKAESPVCTLPDVDAKALANMMADRLAGVKAVKVGELLTHVKGHRTSLDASRHADRGGRQDGWQNTERPEG